MKAKMLTPKGVVEVTVRDRIAPDVIWDALIAEARKQKIIGREVPVIVFEAGKEPYFSVAEDDGAETRKAGDA